MSAKSSTAISIPNSSSSRLISVTVATESHSATEWDVALRTSSGRRIGNTTTKHSASFSVMASASTMDFDLVGERKTMAVELRKREHERSARQIDQNRAQHFPDRSILCGRAVSQLDRRWL